MAKLAGRSPDPALCAYLFSSFIVPFPYQGYHNPLFSSHHSTPRHCIKGTAPLMELRLRPVSFNQVEIPMSVYHRARKDLSFKHSPGE